MGFFKKIFKKKKGGTVFGNLIRGVASSATGGVLGNGTQLRKWEEEQEAKKFDALHAQIADLKKSQTQAVNGRALGNDMFNVAMKHGTEGQTSPNAGEHVILTALKKHWYYVAGAVIVFGSLIYYVSRKSSGGSNRKFKFRK